MTQAWHIFRKDLRHQRVDIAIYLELLLLAGFLIPTGWPGHWTSNQMLPWFRSLVQIVIPIVWLVMIARLVQEEAIVGDRQFWTTRPYRWTSLLGAKLLFVLLCIALPYFVAQWCLAIYGGMSPWQSGFVIAAARHVLIIWIPLILIACITSTFVSTFFTTLAGMVLWTGLLVYLSSSNGPMAQTPFATSCIGIILAVTLVALLIVVYRNRNARLGRILMGCSALFFLILINALSNTSPASLGAQLLKVRYRDGALPQAYLHYVPAKKVTEKPTEEEIDSSGAIQRTVITIPVELLGLPNEVRLHGAAVQYHLEAGDYRYTSPWSPTTLTAHGMTLNLPRPMLTRAGTADAHLTLSLAAEEIAPEHPQTTTIRNRFSIPGGGVCEASIPPYQGRASMTAITCRFAYAVSNPIEIDATMAPGCPIHQVPMEVATHEAGTDFDPVIHVPVNFGTHTLPKEARDCQVQSLTTTVYHPVTYFRTSLDIPSIRLTDYLGN